jgi:hypothetical protein
VAPADVLNIGVADGQVHFGFDIAEAGASERVLYTPSQIAAGLDIAPEFTVVTDADGEWVQCAARADAPTTSPNTNNARSEGREYQPGGDIQLGFNPKDGGTHWVRVRAKIVEHPTVDNAGVATAQLHSLEDDIVMVRSRYDGDTDTNRLVLRVYDPDQSNSVDVATLQNNYQFGDVYDLLILIHGDWCYVFFQDFTSWVYRVPLSILPDLLTYFFKFGCYNQFYEGTAGVSPTDWGEVHLRNGQHWHTGWAPPANYFGCPEIDLGAAASATVGQPFTRTMSATGAGITEYGWAILDGPTGAGTAIGTAAQLSWTPTVAGTYTLIGGARNDQGWSNPTFLTVTVTSIGGGPTLAGIVARLSGESPAAATTHVIGLPPGIEAGDQILVAFTQNHASATAGTTSPGWTTVDTQFNGTSTNVRGTVFHCADSAEGGTPLTVTTSTAQRATWIVYVIRGGGTPIFEAGDEGGANTVATIAPLGSLPAGDYLSIVIVGVDYNTAGFTPGLLAVPPGYGHGVVNIPTISDSAATLGIDRVWDNVTAIEPGTVTYSQSITEQWVSFNIAIPLGDAVETRRFYLPNLPSTTPQVSVASWINDPTGAQTQHLLTEEPAGAPASFARPETSGTAPWYVLLGRWVSDPVSAAGTVYGAWQATLALLESPAGADLQPLVVVFGVVGQTDVRRGTAISIEVDGELDTTAALQMWGGPGTGTDLALQVGDRLVVDFGFVARNTTTDPRTGTLHYGGTTPPDLAAGATDYTRPGWIDLAVTPELSFDQPDVVAGVLAATAPAPTADLAGATRTTGVLDAAALMPVADLQATVGVAGVLGADALLPVADLAGTVRAPGALDVQLLVPTAAMQGDTATLGALAATAPIPTVELAATSAAAGQLTAVAPLPTAHLVGDVAAAATLAASLPVPAVALTGATAASGVVAATLPPPAADFAGQATAVGELAATLPLPIAELGGDGAARGTLHATTPLPGTALTADVTASADLDGALPAPDAALVGTVTAGGGALDATLPAPVATLDATVTADGELATVLPLPLAAIGAGGTSTGHLATELPLPGADLVGDVRVPGALAAVQPMPQAALDSSTETAGQLAVVLPLPTADLHAAASTGGQLDTALPVPEAAVEGTVTGAGVLVASLPLPEAALAADVEDPESSLAVIIPLPTAALTATVTAAGLLAAALPLPTAALVTTPPPTYEGPLRAGRPEWGRTRLRAGPPEIVA